MSPELLDRLTEAGYLEALDREMARALGRIAEESRSEVLLALSLASRAIRRGHVCLDMPALAGRPLLDDLGEPPVDDRAVAVEAVLPDLDAWLEILSASPLVERVETWNSGDEVPPPHTAGSPSPPVNGTTPLVLDEAGRLYLRRYWDHEERLAGLMLSRLAMGEATSPDDGEAAGAKPAAAETLPPGLPVGAEVTRMRQLIVRLFPEAGDLGETDWQRVATLVAAMKRFCVITGGPGTGKTFTVLRVLALQVGLARIRGQDPPRIRLLAPTGKAAARLAESLSGAMDRMGRALEPADREAIPREAATLHRALGMRPGPGTSFRHDASRPIPADLVVVDEASMVDAALMRRLLDALRPEARLVLLGDEHQLASVEAGAVLAEICGDPDAHAYSAGLAGAVRLISGDELPCSLEDANVLPIQDAVVRLRRSYRFDDASGIGGLAEAIRLGDEARALDLLDDPAFPDVSRLRPGAPKPGTGLDAGLEAALLDGYRSLFEPALGTTGSVDAEVEEAATGKAVPSPMARLMALDRFRILCPLRRGPRGVETLNRAAEAVLQAAGLLDLDGRFYEGRPVLIRRNDYALRLFNGDVGLIVPASGEGSAGVDVGSGRGGARVGDRRVAVFPNTEAEGETAIRAISTARLPAHETVFAMSIHKAQGSELDRVLIVLPEHRSPLLSRELLYTAVTRARSEVCIHASEAALRRAIDTRVQRASGLGDRLRRGS